MVHHRLGLGRLTIVGALALLIGTAEAQQGRQGELSALTFHPIPEGAAVYVRLLDDSAENVSIRKLFDDALMANGFAKAEDASGIVLSFVAQQRPGYASGLPRRSFLEVEGRTGSGSDPDDDSRAVLNLYDSQRGAVINKGQGSAIAPTATTVFRLDVTIDDRAGGTSLWQGWAVADLRATNTEKLAAVMVPALIGRIGQTVKEQPFDLP